VTGFAFWGGVGVERKATRAQRQRIEEERRSEKLRRGDERRGLGGSRHDPLGGLHGPHRRERHRDDG
jgi:hypothetical protein